MNSRNVYWLAALVGSTIGGALPGLWGAGAFSATGILTGTIGGIVAIWLAYRATH
jgi:uncharacterized membrane protein YeaQ/YmgE (transglycosylase-associated protein family)